MLNFIKNLINIENIISVRKEQKQEEKKEILDLSYKIESELLLNKNNLPILNPQSYDAEKYAEIINKIQETFTDFNTEIWVNKVVIVNTGNIDINYKDFYENDRLGFDISSSIIAVKINELTTKKYINANVNFDTDDLAHIIFDTLEPNDIIEIDIVSKRKISYFDITGKTKYFDKPHEYHNMCFEKNIVDNTKVSKLFCIIYILICILCLSLFIFCEYLKHKNMGLYIRNPFVIQEVQNDE